MTQSTYLTHIIETNREPPAAATIRQQAVTVKAQAADKAADERLKAKYAAYELTGEWQRMVRNEAPDLVAENDRLRAEIAALRAQLEAVKQ